uniref:NR LBD domain-containing protein n=1 Tax=Caenorhabditis tropicalis TaxID=1561998 RepID=A0A1I7TDJ5_9PELO
MTTTIKTISPFSTVEHYQKIVYELLIQLSKEPQNDQEVSCIEKNIGILRNHVEQILEKRIEALPSSDIDDDDFENEWVILAWGLLTCLSRLPSEIVDREITQSFNHLLVRLVNIARPMRIPKVCPEAKQWWNQFHELYNSSLHYLHGLYSQLDNPNCNIEIKMRAYFTRQLQPCLAALRRTCAENAPEIHSNLRKIQVEKQSMQEKLTEQDCSEIRKYYSSLAYTLGLLAVRLQGFRYECQTCSQNTFATPDTLWELLNEVFITYEHVMNDALMCNEPVNSPIMVTNNLFTFTCHTLCRTLIFSSFDIQIVSEETAFAIRNEIIQCRSGASTPREPKTFPSAALIAMKPTTGVKRNNATANQKGTGGNTAHKKSDVNSQEYVTIPPTFSENSNAWQTTYPHLLCTTRQKDAVLLDSRAGTTGKRPLFYFYIRAKTWSPTGDYIYVRTLSLPFTISTRRNQDCQVQRMNSSYTATCFWMYGTCSINGLLLNWSEKPLTWTQFKTLTRRYFMVNGEVVRTMEESDYDLLQDKMHCEQCGDDSNEFDEEDHHEEEGCISFKNILCSHLRFDTDTVQMRFSVWRGILEVLQIFQDPKAAVKVLWEHYLMHGFLDTQAVVNLLMPRHNCMVIRLTYILGGSVCVSYRNLCGEIIHLEPLELKKLQAKSILEYISDIAETAKIDYLLTYNLEYMPVSSVIEKYFPVDDVKRVRGVASNITDKGPLNYVTHVKFTPLRVAVVACREQTPRPSPRPSESHDIPTSSASENPHDCLFTAPELPRRLDPHQNQNHDPLMAMMMNSNSSSTSSPTATTPTMMTPGPMDQSFEMQLEALMKHYGKTPQEVCEIVSLAARPIQSQNSNHPILAPPITTIRSPSLSQHHNGSFEDMMDDLTNPDNDYMSSLDFSHTNHFLRV